MTLQHLDEFVEQLRAEAIGDPVWIHSKGVFEYLNPTVEVATVLKLVRAGQGVHALNILCGAGLFVDMGAIYRCIDDCLTEVYFILETYPILSSNAKKFLDGFFSRTIDGHLESDHEPVPMQKLRSAMVRCLTGTAQDEPTRTRLTGIHTTFSGYIHAEYSHIMQMFGSTSGNQNFNVAGVKSQGQQQVHFEFVALANDSVLLAVSHAARAFGLRDLDREIVKHFG